MGRTPQEELLKSKRDPPILTVTEGVEVGKAHFQAVMDTPYPRSWTLASHFLSGKLDFIRWMKNAFFWEKKDLYNQLSLYFYCLNDLEKASQYEDLALKQTLIDE